MKNSDMQQFLAKLAAEYEQRDENDAAQALIRLAQLFDVDSSSRLDRFVERIRRARQLPGA